MSAFQWKPILDEKVFHWKHNPWSIYEYLLYREWGIQERGGYRPLLCAPAEAEPSVAECLVLEIAGTPVVYKTYLVSRLREEGGS